MPDEWRSTEPRPGDEVRTIDAEQHGDDPPGHDRQIGAGRVKSQRGHSAELPPPAVARGYEPTDVSIGGVSLAIAALLGGVVLSVALVVGLLSVLRARDERPAVGRLATETIAPSGPRLAVKPLPERIALEEAARAQLRSYARIAVEPNRGRIPIERAMQLLAAHGWPDSDIPPAVRRLPGRLAPDAARRASPSPVADGAFETPAPLGAPP